MGIGFFCAASAQKVARNGVFLDGYAARELTRRVLWAPNNVRFGREKSTFEGHVWRRFSEICLERGMGSLGVVLVASVGQPEVPFAVMQHNR